MTSSAELKTAPSSGTTVANGDGMFYDVLLEALSYLEDGAWSGFEDAFESVSAAHESPDQSARDVARKLAALGHIDVRLDRFTLRPEKWSVSPSALLRLCEGEMVLCGRRPAALLASLGAEAGSYGCHVSIERLTSQPARIEVRPIEEGGEGAAALVEGLREQGHDLTINDCDASHLARALPTLPKLIEHMRRSVPPHGGAVEKLLIEHGRLRWTPVSDYTAPGSYRFNPPPVLYGYVESEDAAPVRVDARLARLLALSTAGHDAFAWDPGTKVAEAAYYAEPPGLYERALVLCSGYAPDTNLREGVTRYRDVTEEVAIAVHQAISALRDLPSDDAS